MRKPIINWPKNWQKKIQYKYTLHLKREMTIQKFQIKKFDMTNNANNKPAVANSTVTRDLRELDAETGNIYESLVIMSKRANQISNNIKEELHQKLSEFASVNDNLEEVFENREQIEISKYYEKLPKPTLVAVQEFLDNKIYYRNPSKEQQ